MLVTNYDILQQAIDDFQNAKLIVFDTETDGLRPYHGNRIIGLAYYFPEVDRSYYIPIRHGNGWNVDLEAIKPFKFWPGNATVIMFNAKFDLHMSYVDGFIDPHTIEDVQIAAHLLNENEWLSNDYKSTGAYTLKRLSRKYLGDWAVSGEQALEQAAKERKLDPKADIKHLPLDIVAEYAEMDVIITYRLREFYKPFLHKWQLWQLYLDHNRFMLKMLLRMERNGMRVNQTTIQTHLDGIEPAANALRVELENAARSMGFNFDPFNPNSPKQVLAFFAMQGHSLARTDRYALTGLSNVNQWASKILEYRGLSKSAGTYYRPYLDHVDPNSVIHTSLNAAGPNSGRLSSYNPNFQNVPRKNERAMFNVKEVFEPRNGWWFAQYDYKQLELRLAVHYAQEKTMRDMFLSGADMHQYTADNLLVNRHTGKTANFSFLYGMGKDKGSIFLGTSIEEAYRIIEGWHLLYPNFRKALYATNNIAQMRRNPDGTDGGSYQFVRLEYGGRVRRFHEYLDYPYWADRKEKSTPPYFAAWNFLIQGTAGYITEASLLRIAEDIPDDEIMRPVLTVHDSYLAEINPAHKIEVDKHIQHVMINWPGLVPPMQVDAGFSLENWAKIA